MYLKEENFQMNILRKLKKKNNFDTDNLNPFECTYATFVSEDLSFVYEFK